MGYYIYEEQGWVTQTLIKCNYQQSIQYPFLTYIIARFTTRPLRFNVIIVMMSFSAIIMTVIFYFYTVIINQESIKFQSQ